MELIIKNRWKKIKIKFSDYMEKRLIEFSKKYGMEMDSLLKILIDKKFKNFECEEEKDIEKEINSLKQVMFSVETKWSSLRYEAHTYLKDNRKLAITLQGYINENKRLHTLLKSPVEIKEIEEIANYYLWL